MHNCWCKIEKFLCRGVLRGLGRCCRSLKETLAATPLSQMDEQVGWGEAPAAVWTFPNHLASCAIAVETRKAPSPDQAPRPHRALQQLPGCRLCGVPGPTPFPSSLWSMFPQSCPCCHEGKQIPTLGAAAKLHVLRPVIHVVQCRCLAMQFVAKRCRGNSHLSLPFAAYDSPNECCYNHAEKPIRHIEYFYETPNTCSLPAVV